MVTVLLPVAVRSSLKSYGPTGNCSRDKVRAARSSVELLLLVGLIARRTDSRQLWQDGVPPLRLPGDLQ